MKKMFTFLLAIVASVAANATKTLIDGIYYGVDFWSGTACVAYGSCKSGEVNIRSVVNLKYNNKYNDYTVTIIDRSAFRGCTDLTSVFIPSTITTINEMAFEGCTGLTSLTLFDEIRTIKYSAFENCTGLINVTMQEGGVTTIESSTFKGCTALTSFIVPSNVTSIASDAFYDVPNIVYSGSATGSPWGAKCINGYVDGFFVYSDDTKTTLMACSSEAQGAIVIPNSVTSIGKRAFSGCTGLTSVTIPNSVTSIGEYAFSGCTGLTSVTIPNSVTSIGEYAFSGCNSLTSVMLNSNTIANRSLNKIFGPQVTEYILGESITSIGKRAFSGCTGLTSVTIPNSVTSIGEYAFSGCTGLTSVTIPNSVTSIGNNAFSNVYNILYSGSATGSPWGAKCVNGYVDGFLIFSDDTKTTLKVCLPLATGSIVIPNSVTTIGSSAFSGCSGLTSVTIPNSVTSIGKRAFSGCTGLTSVTIPNSVTSIGESAFSGCSGLTSVTIPNSVTSIGESAFSGCSGLTSVTIPNSVTTIGSSAFSGCSGLTSITIPNSVTSIGESAFSGCSGLTSVTIPNSVTSIGERAFSDCSSLTAPVYNNKIFAYMPASYSGSYSIPDGIETIIAYAFSGCSGLTSVTIPNSVTNIGDGAFFGCSGLTAPVYNNKIFAYMPASYSGSYSIPDGIETIIAYAFSGCSGLTSLTIPNSVTNIGYGAFYGCSGLTAPVYNNKIFAYMPASYSGSYSIPDGIETIIAYAFSGCSGLTSVTIPNSVTSIGERAFSDCTGLTSITIPNSVTSIGNNAFSNVYNILYSGSATGSPWGAKCVNGYVDGFLIFSDDTKTTLKVCLPLATGSIVIPNSVTSIGESAFYGCNGLTSITIPNSVTTIGSSAFSGCSNLKDVYVTDLTKWCTIRFGDIYANPLYYAHNLYLNGTLVTDLIIPNTVASIGNYAFEYCRSLTSVAIGNSVTSIGDGAFLGCSSLTSLTIPNSVTSIGNYAFEYCSGLTSLTIPNSVTSIGQAAFGYCDNLAIVTIGKSIKDIGGYAFNKTNLKTINISALIPPQIHEASFGWSPSTVTAYVPAFSLDAYMSAEGWNEMNIQVRINEVAVSPTGCIISFEPDGTIASIGVEGGEQQPGNVLEYIGLEPESEYKDVPVVLTSNTGETGTVKISFTTTALELTTQPSKTVSATTAILLAETNMSDAEVSCGFEYKRNDAPADMAGTKVFCPVASGQMAGRLKNLKDDVYYKYRAFYQSAGGNMYYGDWQYIFTGDNAVEFDPILYTYGATVVRENEANISGYALAGSEDFTEQGFEYWAESRANNGANAPHRMPAALNEHFFVQASGIALRATLNNLDAGTVYRYRVYGKVGDQYYYGSEQTFTTTGTYTPPTYTITFANWDGATLQSSQVEEGTLPEYTGVTPIRPDDEQYTYVFDGWTPAIVVATADATYTATYQSEPKSQGIEDIQGDDVQCTKVLRDGTIYILRGDKTYTLTGQEVK